MLDHRSELGVRIVVIAFAPASALAAYQDRQGLGDLLVLSDPDRRAYRAFGFERGSVARVWLDPRVWARYAALLLRGRRVRRTDDEDVLQLGGDVLLDADGRVRWIYASSGPADRPDLAQLIAVRRGRWAGGRRS